MGHVILHPNGKTYTTSVGSAQGLALLGLALESLLLVCGEQRLEELGPLF